MGYLEEFKQLWKDTSNMVTYECNRLIASNDKKIIEKINKFYSDNVLKSLWLTTTLPNKYSDWLNRLSSSNPKEGEEVKKCLLDNSQLLKENHINLLSKLLIGSSLTLSGVGLMTKKEKVALLGIASSGASYLLSVLFNGKMAKSAKKLALQRLTEIGRKVEAILTEYDD